MKKAIITGSTGLVGMTIARHFASKGIEVLGLGSKNLESEYIKKHFHPTFTYIELSMENILSLKERIDEIEWIIDDECVFYHFAWRGDKGLTDGSFARQIDNAVFSAQAVQAAKSIGCTRFVNTGTLEETYAERYLENKDIPYNSSQSNYAISKLASRDLSIMQAYLEKIDYIHTRLSIPLDPDLKKGTYVASTLRKILEGKGYEVPKNKQLFDIIFIDDLARAYYQIGINGKNKADYFIGSSSPATLKDYFQRLNQLVHNTPIGKPETSSSTDIQMFSTEDLYRDTGFVSNTHFENLVKIHKS